LAYFPRWEVGYPLSTNSNTAQGESGDFYFDEFFWVHGFAQLRKVAAAMATLTITSAPISRRLTKTHEAYAFWSGEEWNRGRRKGDQQALMSATGTCARARSCPMVRGARWSRSTMPLRAGPFLDVQFIPHAFAVPFEQCAPKAHFHLMDHAAQGRLAQVYLIRGAAQLPVSAMAMMARSRCSSNVMQNWYAFGQIMQWPL
jgi:hypothetical protein